MLPLFIDMRLRKVVVFGGGQVGLRKARFFAKEADVVVVSRHFCEGFDTSEVQIVEEDALERLVEWVGWADVVIACTDDDAVNSAIVNQAVATGKLYNCSDGRSNFLIPSVVERDGYTVAISTFGRSPAMAKYLRTLLDEELGPEHGRMVLLQETLREEAKRLIPDQKRREQLLWDVLKDERIWQLVREGEMKKAMTAARRRMVKGDGQDP
ncbi:MAG: bifunctional precorrin-2 dehydrogenase/sirohydrochlorin ferrochelatase [Methanomassiliicoccales archaeon]|nr:MAG: bifunctional precorrin-2 dehydrogenase/sirohydrochlorin ferrochelatase [Methanomassiliicoccales archaeon]